MSIIDKLVLKESSSTFGGAEYKLNQSLRDYLQRGYVKYGGLHVAGMKEQGALKDITVSQEIRLYAQGESTESCIGEIKATENSEQEI